MGMRTPLYQAHVDAGAKIVDFGGWDMPLHYGSQIEEHHTVRQAAGMFDVSHMTVVDVFGVEAVLFLQKLLANDVAKLNKPGKGLYSCMLNEQGGVIDDLIAYLRRQNSYRVIVNAATRDSDIEWMQQVAASFDVTVMPADDYVMLAVQGPDAINLAAEFLPAGLHAEAQELEAFQSCEADGIFVARTGYTGEDGWELVIPADHGMIWWNHLIAAGVQPCGLGARDTLRLEAGMNLYGQDMDATVTPLESALGWTVAWEPAERNFIGRDALEVQRKAGPAYKFVGLMLRGRGIMRHGQHVVTNLGDGEVTSGSFSPSMECSIALARIPAGVEEVCQVEIRGKHIDADIVKPPFVRNGQIKIITALMNSQK
ncbi:MAG: glycine cleavage system aminomethyltransferase GcvT [Gammaproteobacteria bacterium]|nr:glycine cleavage system aminomethyltransferase GcvT [Gammaproteobacteria bacterium]